MAWRNIQAGSKGPHHVSEHQSALALGSLPCNAEEAMPPGPNATGLALDPIVLHVVHVRRVTRLHKD